MISFSIFAVAVSVLSESRAASTIPRMVRLMVIVARHVDDPIFNLGLGMVFSGICAAPRSFSMVCDGGVNVQPDFGCTSILTTPSEEVFSHVRLMAWVAVLMLVSGDAVAVVIAVATLTVLSVASSSLPLRYKRN